MIAAINGAAVGVGVTMTLPCDVRIAAAGAKLGLTFAKLGMLPGLGSTHLLPRLVGLAKAQEPTHRATHNSASRRRMAALLTRRAGCRLR